MHRHVYGQIHGRLEHCVPNVQLQVAEGASSHVNQPPREKNKKKTLYLPPFIGRLLLRMRISTGNAGGPQCSRTTSAVQQSPRHHRRRRMRPVDSDPWQSLSTFLFLHLRKRFPIQFNYSCVIYNNKCSNSCLTWNLIRLVGNTLRANKCALKEKQKTTKLHGELSVCKY